VRYAVAETVYRLCDIDPDTEDQDVLDDLESLEEGVAQTIDNLCNRTFGEAPLTATRDIAYYIQPIVGYPYYYGTITTWDGITWFADMSDYGYGTPYGISPYVTPWGMKDITAVFVDGTWNGTIWEDETEVESDSWRLVFVNQDGWAHGLLLPGVGYGSVRVTASWEDGAESLTVPPDIREAANLVVADQWRTNHQSPAGEIGPPGLAVFIRDPWKFQLVKSAIDRHTFRQLVV
jgi:hypothetical protein